MQAYWPRINASFGSLYSKSSLCIVLNVMRKIASREAISESVKGVLNSSSVVEVVEFSDWPRLFDEHEVRTTVKQIASKIFFIKI